MHTKGKYKNLSSHARRNITGRHYNYTLIQRVCQ